MILREMAEVAALASANSAHLIEGSARLPDLPMQKFWKHSRQRLHRWIRCLEQYPADAKTEADRNTVWDRTAPVLEEVFVCDVLTRVWATILAAADRKRGVSHAEPIARNVMQGHMKARNLSLNLLVNGSQIPMDQLIQMDRVRRRTERWTDLLLGHLVVQYQLGEFAIEEQRAVDFGTDQLNQGILDPQNLVWDMILAGLRIAFPDTKSFLEPNLRDHRGIIGSVMATFPPDAFQATGPFKPILHARIARSGIQAEGPPASTNNNLDFPIRPARRLVSAKSPSGISFLNLRQQFRRDS